jgi:hypothetical protein
MERSIKPYEDKAGKNIPADSVWQKIRDSAFITTPSATIETDPIKSSGGYVELFGKI